MENFIGELSALGAALCFSFASTAFTLAGRKYGATVSMALSLQISLIFLLPIHQIVVGEIFPMTASPERWLLLGTSSLAGFVISSVMLLRAFQYIGPRLSMLVGASTPIFAALMAWIALGQGLPSHSAFGIALVIVGIVWAVSDGAKLKDWSRGSQYRRGMLLAIGSAIGQGASFVLMSEGMAGGFHVMSASVIRTLVGVVIFWLYMSIRGISGNNLRTIFREPRAFLMLVVATLTGPVIGTTLVLLSLQFTGVGVSSTLTGTTPILLIPISFVVFKEAITLRAVMGTIVAIAGVAILFAS